MFEHSWTVLVEHCSSGTFLTVVAHSWTDLVEHCCSLLVTKFVTVSVAHCLSDTVEQAWRVTVSYTVVHLGATAT